MRNRIDRATIETETKLVSANKLTDELFQSQETMINHIKMFEKDCLSELTKKGTNDLVNMDETQNMINIIEQKTEKITNSMDLSLYEDIKVLIGNFTAHIQEKIFIKRGLVLARIIMKNIDEDDDEIYILVIVTDTFVPHDLFCNR